MHPRIHLLQHVAFEGPAYLRAWIEKKGYPLTSTLFFQPGWRLPATGDVDALIILGGPMGISQEASYPWLVAEKRWIETAVAEGKKIFGICLGAQLLAHCLGARVAPAPFKEIGWFPLSLTSQAAEFPWLCEAFGPSPTVFHWHGDRFELPKGAHDLVVSPANDHQAYFLPPHLLGLQFHLEMTDASIERLLDHGKADWIGGGPFVQDAEKIREGYLHLPSCHRILERLLERWLAAG